MIRLIQSVLFFLLVMSTKLVAQTFTVKTPMPIPRMMAVSAAVGTKVYVIGGQTSGGVITNMVHEYNVVTDTWAQKADFPHPILQAFACTYNGKVYVVGGCTGQTSVTSVWEYDPAVDTWTAKSSVPTSRCEISGALINGKVYITSGWPYEYTTLEIYDIATDTWTTGPDAPQGLLQINSGAEYNGLFFAIGGKNYTNTIWYNDVMIYSPTSSIWHQGAALPQSVYAGAAVTYKNKIHYFGGGISLSASSFDTHYLFDSTNPFWVTGVTMPYPLYSPTAVTVHSNEINKVYIFGGKAPNDSVTAHTLEYSEAPSVDVTDFSKEENSLKVTYDVVGQKLRIFSHLDTQYDVMIYSAVGALVKKVSFSGRIQDVDATGLSAGYYVVKVETDGHVYRTKFLIQ